MDERVSWRIATHIHTCVLNYPKITFFCVVVSSFRQPKTERMQQMEPIFGVI